MSETEKAKPKFKLEDLKVQSFVTTLGNADKLRLKAGDATWTDATAGCCATLPVSQCRACTYPDVCPTDWYVCCNFSGGGGGGGGGDTGCFGSFMY